MTQPRERCWGPLPPPAGQGSDDRASVFLLDVLRGCLDALPSEHVSRVLNHAEGGPTATHVYNRYTYDAEKRAALDSWARTLTKILERNEAGTIVPFERRT